ncbi:MAG: aminotransferase class I/II-fold pyridoxal phosphate-dependent enzyme [Planctomycetota bacterium]
MFAKRVRNLRPSGIRRIFELAKELEDPINLSIGQAHFDVPEPVKAAAIDAIASGHNRYTVTQGLPELRARVREYLRARSGHAPEGCLITSGVSGGLVLAALCLIDPGDEVLLPDPYFVIYRVLVELLDAKPVFYDTYPDFRVRAPELERLITPKTKMLLIGSPSNPTGSVLSEDELAAIARIASAHGLLVVADEIYDAFVYDGPYRSILEFLPSALVLGGLSKTYGMPGWRIGYAVGEPDLIDMMMTLQQFTFVCAPTPSQHAAVKAFDVDMSAWIEQYRRKRQRMMEALAPHYEIVEPAGSFYMFPRLPAGETESSFLQRALERKLLIVPGSACSTRASHFRISFAAPDHELERGIRVLSELAMSTSSAKSPAPLG